MDDIELTIRLIMNHKQACQAIGRSGSNIKSLRDETGCKITMTNKDHPKRIMTISSKKSAAMKAIQRLAEILESELNSYGASNRLVPITVTLVIPKNICGLIIGKKGENLKDLRVKSGAQIALSADCLPKSDERTCQLTGSNFAVVAAVDLIVEIIINAAIQESKGEFKGTPSSEIVPYDPKHDTPENNRDEKDDKLVKLATAFLTASEMVDPHLEYRPIEVSDQVQELRVPKEHIGAVLGRGGKRINDVRMMSGCKVKIEREDGTPMRRITLTGEKSKIVMATYLINQTISTFSTAPKKEQIKAEAPMDPKLTDTSGLDQMNSLHPGGLNTDEQAAAAMTAFFQSQFSGGYTAPEYIPAPQSSKADENTEELSQEELAQQKQIPDMYTIPEKRPRLHY